MTVQFSVLVEKHVVGMGSFAEALVIAHAHIADKDTHISMHRATPAEIEAFDQYDPRMHDDSGYFPEPELSPDDIRDMMVLKDIFAAQHPH
jgi:hypothetical protein